MAYTLSTLPFEVTEIQGDNVTPARLIWRRYKRPYPGIVEIFLDLNPHVLRHLQGSPFLPVGAIVRIPIDQKVLAGKIETGVKAVDLFPKSA